MAKRKTNPDYLNGVPELLILGLLSQEPMYGYQIVEAIRTQSEDVLSFGEGCIYPVLHRLEKQKTLKAVRAVVNGRNRVTYQLTAQGKRQLSESRSEWSRVIDAIQTVLAGGNNEYTTASI